MVAIKTNALAPPLTGRPLVLLVLISMISSSKGALIVEPFLGQWCAKQFPDQINEFSGYDMVFMLGKDNHKKIEPFLGKWCFAQFSELGSLDENEAITSLYTKHEQIEQYFKMWGEDSFATASTSSNTAGNNLVNIEPYVGQWCAAQYPKEIKTNKKDLVAAVQANHIKFEPALARWCFAQFPSELSGLNAESVVEGLNTDHELVENELIKWVLSTRHQSQNRSAKEKSLMAGLIIFAVSFALLLATVLFVGRRRWLSGKQQEVEFLDDNNTQDQEGEGSEPAII